MNKDTELKEPITIDNPNRDVGRLLEQIRSVHLNRDSKHQHLISPDIQTLIEQATVRQRDKIDPPEVVIHRCTDESDYGVPLLTQGNLSLVKGKAKGGKTFLVSMIVAAASGNDPVLGVLKGELKEGKRGIVYFDTEQSEGDVQTVLKRIKAMSSKLDDGGSLRVLSLRGYDVQTRLRIIREIALTQDGLGLMIIDGVKDLVSSINDEKEVNRLSTEFLNWTQQFNFHMMLVLHENKGNAFARGHLGSELVNKSELIMAVTRDKKGRSKVVIEESRRQPAEGFSFSINEDGIPELVEARNMLEETKKRKPIPKPSEVNNNLHIKVLDEVFKSNEKPSYSSLYLLIQEVFSKHDISFGQNKSKEYVKWYTDKGIISKSESQPYYLYHRFSLSV